MIVLEHPLFWIALYAAGCGTVLSFLGPKKLRIWVYQRVPKGVLMPFMVLFFILPPIGLPFAEGPRMGMPPVMAFGLGGVLFAANVIFKIMSQRKIGTMPALKAKGKLVTDGIYRVVRHPLYMSNVLLALGMALLGNSLYALCFCVPYFACFLLIIYFEESELVDQYGEEYLVYKRHVPWRLVPKVF